MKHLLISTALMLAAAPVSAQIWHGPGGWRGGGWHHGGFHSGRGFYGAPAYVGGGRGCWRPVRDEFGDIVMWRNVCGD